MRVCNGWRRFLLCLPLIFFLPHILSGDCSLPFFNYRANDKNISSLNPTRDSTIENLHKRQTKKFDHLVLGPAAGEGLQDRLQCQGIKALNRAHYSASSEHSNLGASIALVTVFAAYGSNTDRLLSGGSEHLVTVGNVSYNKVESEEAQVGTAVAFLETLLEYKSSDPYWQPFHSIPNLISFPQRKDLLLLQNALVENFLTCDVRVTMPQSNIIILTDPASKLPVHSNRVTVYPIKGEYSRDKLMLQRIRSYIVFLEARLKEQSQRQGRINHYIFTDSDVAVVDDLGQIFSNYPNFDVALTFRNNKDQPLNSGFIAVRGTSYGIQRAMVFLQEVLKVYISKYMKASRMLGDQLALAWIVKSHPSVDAKRFTRARAFLEEIGGASVLFLPCALYNWTPPEGSGQFHGMPLDVKVVHFKGSRKRLMLESWNFLSSSPTGISDMLCLILRSGRTKYDF